MLRVVENVFNVDICLEGRNYCFGDYLPLAMRTHVQFLLSTLWNE